MFLKKSLLIAAVGAAAFAPLAQADTIGDIYNGGPDAGDVVGDPNTFDIMSLSASRVGSQIRVDVQTRFAGQGHRGLFAGITNTAAGQGRGVGYGDLFLAETWAPFGSELNRFNLDTAFNSTRWQYGFSLDNRWAEQGGNGSLYELNGSNDENNLLSNDFFSGGNWRDNQEVAVDLNSSTVVDTGNDGTWVVDDANDVISFFLDVSGTSLEGKDTLAFRWEMTCANDAIEGQVNIPHVPAPAAAPLIGLAALGLLARRRRKQTV